MIILKHSHDCCLRKLVCDFPEDGIRVMAHNAIVSQNSLVDTQGSSHPKLAARAHRDAIQLIPTDPPHHNQQFAAASLSGVRIAYNHIHACGSQLQGIFASDGLFDDLSIWGNVIETQSQHKITVNGMRSGYIAGNVNTAGELVPVQLNPLRIGGFHNVWVIGFKDGADDYQPLESMIDRASSWDHVEDNRRKVTRPGDIYLTGFDLKGFRQVGRNLYAADARGLCEALVEVALGFGERVC